MIQISKLLVVVEDKFDQHALISEVSAVAGQFGAKVTLLGITDPPPDDPEIQVAQANLYEWTKTAQLRDLEELCEALEQAGISTTVQQAVGKPYEEIIRAAVTGGYDLTMKPAAEEAGRLNFLFGSTDMQLFRLSPDPVWIFKPTLANKLARIMIAVDLLAFDEEKSALAEKILRWGKSVADVVGAKLHVLHIWDLHREFTLRSKVGPSSVDSLLQALEQRHREWLDQAIAKAGLDTDKITVHFRKGDAEEMIPAVAQAQKIDLLVMGTVGRTGIPGFFIGNTADSVLRQVNCSVLAIKPDGFRTPIKI
ncbi:MAG TPA: universal stress protein [Woeseiaceae bacterium]|nr:universal stress protein [Woeseiaceae bacterium]